MEMSREQKEWVCQTLERTAAKLEKTVVRSAEKIPYTTVNGVHDDRSGEQIGWWTNGFWGGMMWQMYVLTGNASYRRIAERSEEKLDACLLDYEKLDHDNGFRWLPTAVADYRLTENPASRNRALLAASNLAGRYNSGGHFIRAWNSRGRDAAADRTGWAIIDCMMNLPLLYWAGEELGDPRFYQIAVSHADKTMQYFVRGDGSVRHIVRFDPQNGEMAECFGGQGCGPDSAWSRGQSWGLYGFVLSFLHTNKASYLDTAQRIANYLIANIPEDGLLPVDFRQPEDVGWIDSSAAAIASCGLIELAKLTKGRQSGIYLGAAMKLLEAITERSVNWNENEDNLLEKCTVAYHDREHEISLIYGDYYYLEALMKLDGRGLFIW